MRRERDRLTETNGKRKENERDIVCVCAYFCEGKWARSRFSSSSVPTTKDNEWKEGGTRTGEGARVKIIRILGAHELILFM